MDMTKYIDLERHVTIAENGFKLTTEKVTNTEYAFYLNHSQGTEKFFYSESSDVSFNIPVKPGNYFASFFYKCKNIVHKEVLFFVVDSSKQLFLAEQSLIIEEVEYCVDYYNKESPVTFIVFNTDGSNKKRMPFGLAFLIKLGFNVVAVKHNNNCYQPLSFETFRDIVRPLVVDKDVYLYGTSLGGYCALYYAGSVNGTVIASAPRNPIHPVIKAMTVAKGEHSYLHQDMNLLPHTNRLVLVIMDITDEIDKVFFDEVVSVAYPNLKLLNISNVGHDVLAHLTFTREIKPIILNVVNGHYNQISVDVNKLSPHQEHVIALNFYRQNRYREAVFHAGQGLLYSNKEKYDKRLASLLKSAIDRL